MAKRGMHLLKGAPGFMAKTACGNRNAILAGDYKTFMADGAIRCEKCAVSKTAVFFAKSAAKPKEVA